jgi:hypothetical protein
MALNRVEILNVGCAREAGTKLGSSRLEIVAGTMRSERVLIDILLKDFVNLRVGP